MQLINSSAPPPSHGAGPRGLTALNGELRAIDGGGRIKVNQRPLWFRSARGTLRRARGGAPLIKSPAAGGDRVEQSRVPVQFRFLYGFYSEDGLLRWFMGMRLVRELLGYRKLRFCYVMKSFSDFQFFFLILMIPRWGHRPRNNLDCWQVYEICDPKNHDQLCEAIFSCSHTLPCSNPWRWSWRVFG